MSQVVSTDGVIEAAEPEAAQEAGLAQKTLGLGFWLAVGWIALIVLLALFAPWLPLKDPNQNFIDIQGKGRPPYGPSADHWLGSDQDARDMLSRTIYGARVSLVVGFVAVSFGFLIGGTVGLVSGFVRGVFDKISSFIMLVLLSFPALILAILITSLMERSLWTIALTLGILAVAPVGRLARAASLVFAEREFVLAARTMGAKPSHIMLRELLPNVLIPMSALALLGTAVAIVAEGGLAFLGLSVEKGSTWGKLILTGANSRQLEEAPWIAFVPIAALFLTVMALNFAGDRLREYFDVRELSL
ncbi:MAG: ABC transporter permease [Acidimicrobiales bacterium]|jgi:peptide/nickel transport system permease protein